MTKKEIVGQILVILCLFSPGQWREVLAPVELLRDGVEVAWGFR